MSKIVSLTASNYMRLKAVHIRPDGPIVQLRGKNRAGKSSVIAAIWAALGGKEAVPSVPVRVGEEQATIRLELDDLIVTRIIKPDGDTKLDVRGVDGRKHASPQALLNKLVAGLSFDPLAFTRMKKAERNETLRQLLGIDFTDLDKERTALFDQRTDIGREARRLEGELSGATFDVNAPTSVVSVEALVEELTALRGQAERRAQQNQEAARMISRAEQSEGEAKVVREQIRTLEERARGLDQQALRQRQGAAAILEDAEASPGPSIADMDAISARIAGAESVNASVRENQRHTLLVKKVDDERARYRELTTRIDEIDAEKARQLQEAKYPLPTMRLTEDGVTMNGLPFEQASGAEQLRASVAMGMALRPDLRVLLVREGSLLDDEALTIMAAMADEWGGSVWLETVSNTREGPGILIEDGEVSLVESAAAE